MPDARTKEVRRLLGAVVERLAQCPGRVGPATREWLAMDDPCQACPLRDADFRLEFPRRGRRRFLPRR